MPTNVKIIDEFCSYFYGQIRSIKSIRSGESQINEASGTGHQLRFYKKVLLITVLDILAGIRFPKQRYPALNKTNRQRFKRFIKDSGCWEGGELVSIPFLAEFALTKDLSDGLLKNHVLEKLSNFNADGAFNIRFTEIDEPIKSLLSLAATEKEEKAIEDCQHLELMYRYRNYLVHEAREPGSAMEIFPDED